MFPACLKDDDGEEEPDRKEAEVTIRKLTISLIGAAAVAASILLVRQQKQLTPQDTIDTIPPGETTQTSISLDRLRELGL